MLVYFICTGNTCRSPMAAALYYKHLNDNGTNYVQVESGGLAAYEGDKVSDNAVEACKELNVDISNHIAHRLRGKDLIRGNFFVVMEPVHRQILVEAGVDPDQVYVLGGPEGIPDPYKKDAEEFRKVRDQIIASFADLDHVLFTQAKQAWKNKYECRHSNGTYAGKAYSRSGSAGAALLFPAMD